MLVLNFNKTETNIQINGRDEYVITENNRCNLILKTPSRVHSIDLFWNKKTDFISKNYTYDNFDAVRI